MSVIKSVNLALGMMPNFPISVGIGYFSSVPKPGIPSNMLNLADLNLTGTDFFKGLKTAGYARGELPQDWKKVQIGPLTLSRFAANLSGVISGFMFLDLDLFKPKVFQGLFSKPDMFKEMAEKGLIKLDLEKVIRVIKDEKSADTNLLEAFEALTRLGNYAAQGDNLKLALILFSAVQTHPSIKIRAMAAGYLMLLKTIKKETPELVELGLHLAMYECVEHELKTREELFARRGTLPLPWLESSPRLFKAGFSPEDEEALLTNYYSGLTGFFESHRLESANLLKVGLGDRNPLVRRRSLQLVKVFAALRPGDPLAYNLITAGFPLLKDSDLGNRYLALQVLDEALESIKDSILPLDLKNFGNLLAEAQKEALSATTFPELNHRIARQAAITARQLWLFDKDKFVDEDKIPLPDAAEPTGLEVLQRLDPGLAQKLKAAKYDFLKRIKLDLPRFEKFMTDYQNAQVCMRFDPAAISAEKLKQAFSALDLFEEFVQTGLIKLDCELAVENLDLEEKPLSNVLGAAYYARYAREADFAYIKPQLLATLKNASLNVRALAAGSLLYLGNLSAAEHSLADLHFRLGICYRQERQSRLKQLAAEILPFEKETNPLSKYWSEIVNLGYSALPALNLAFVDQDPLVSKRARQILIILAFKYEQEQALAQITPEQLKILYSLVPELYLHFADPDLAASLALLNIYLTYLNVHLEETKKSGSLPKIVGQLYQAKAQAFRALESTSETKVQMQALTALAAVYRIMAAFDYLDETTRKEGLRRLHKIEGLDQELIVPVEAILKEQDNQGKKE